jgi:hypothetical protein
MSLLAGPAGGFEVGDLYLLSDWLPTSQPGICRIDPVSGSTSVLVDLPAAGQGAYHMTFSYDGYRDRLIFTTNDGLWMVDDAGIVTDFDPGFGLVPSLVAPRGDGILYLYNAGEGFTYVDAADALHDLLDESGLARFGFGVNARLNELIFDPVTNSLICFQSPWNGVNIAECSDPDAPCALRIPLTADGTQVAGTVTAAQSDVSALWYSSELVVGAGLAPGGVVWVADTNTNEQEPRMQFLDTVAMTSGGYASNGPYIGAASTSAGTYSSVRGQAVILDDYADVVRAYSAGETGAGTQFPGVSGATARLIEVGAGLGGASAAPAVRERSVPEVVVAPNPFSRATTLRFDLPADAELRVVVYDAAGRPVRRLADRQRGIGLLQLRWDGLADDGSPVASGVYFVALESDAGRTTQKVVRAK